jgi:hypothetical protein
MFRVSGLVFGVTEGVVSRFHVLRAGTHFWRYRGRRVPFSCFALPDRFSAVRRASGPIFMFCALGLVFNGIEGVGSRFHVLRSRTRFPRYVVWVLFSCFASLTRFWRFRGRRVPFLSFACSDSFSAVPRVSGPVFKFCAPRHVYGGAECIGSRFNVLCARIHFRRCRGRRVPFSCFALPDTFPALWRASGLDLMFCALGHFFGGSEGVGSRFHILRSQTRFWRSAGIQARFHVLRPGTRFQRYRGRRVSFSCFVRRDSFSTVPRASAPVLLFCAHGLIFGVTEGVESRFNVLLTRTRFRHYRGRPVPFSCFALPDMFSVMPSASGNVFKFFAPELVFGGPEGFVSPFHVLRSMTRFRRNGWGRVLFVFCVPKLVFGDSEGAGSRFLILRNRNRSPRYRGHRVLFSYFTRPNSFSTVPRMSGPVFMFCAP